MCVQKGDSLGLTPIGSPKITWDDPMGLFYCHHLKAEYLRSILSFYRTQNTSKTPKLCLFENLNKMVAAPILYFWVNIERSCQWISNLNDIHTRGCTLMSRHDIDIKIIKHWLVLHNTCWITSYFTEGEIRFATLYLLNWLYYLY